MVNVMIQSVTVTQEWALHQRRPFDDVRTPKMAIRAINQVMMAVCVKRKLMSVSL